MAAQPVGEFKHLDIAPHPGRETHEGFAAPWARGMVADIAVDVGGVRPVRLDRNDVEDVMRDQLPGDGGRSEERRAGKDGVSTCKSRWSPYHSKKIRTQRSKTCK